MSNASTLRPYRLLFALAVIGAVYAYQAWFPSDGGAVHVDFEVERARIMDIMAQQEAAWSNGDVEAFMQPYWHSDSLLFVGSKGPTYGWQQTLDNYRKSYPSQEAMGDLSFEVVNIEPAGAAHALMLGAWKLSRGNGLEDLDGWFSLVWEKREGRWVIIRDHSS